VHESVFVAGRVFLGWDNTPRPKVPPGQTGAGIYCGARYIAHPLAVDGAPDITASRPAGLRARQAGEAKTRIYVGVRHASRAAHIA